MIGMAGKGVDAGDPRAHFDGFAVDVDNLVASAEEDAWDVGFFAIECEVVVLHELTRFGAGGSRVRRIGIVALARKLLIALWRYLETGVLPEGARCKA